MIRRIFLRAAIKCLAGGRGILWRGIGLIAAASCLTATAETLALLRDGDLTAWEYNAFDDIAETQYETRYDESLGAAAVFATSDKGASGYIRRMEMDIQKTPWLHLQWRVDATGDGFDERVKEGDDFALRVYFAGREGLVKYKSLSLVRAQGQRGDKWQSPYANWFNDLRIYAIGGGAVATGEWQTSAINLAALWQELFDDTPRTLGLVGFMTDGDSAGVAMRARYGAIVLTDSAQSPFAK